MKRLWIVKKTKINDKYSCIKNKWPKKGRFNVIRHQKPNINAKNKKKKHFNKILDENERTKPNATITRFWRFPTVAPQIIRLPT